MRKSEAAEITHTCTALAVATRSRPSRLRASRHWRAMVIEVQIVQKAIVSVLETMILDENLLRGWRWPT